MRKEIEAIVKNLWGYPDPSAIEQLTALFESKLEEVKRPTAQQLTYLPDHEKLRREHWSRVYSAYANHSDGYLYASCIDLADQALEAFDNKFNHQP